MDSKKHDNNQDDKPKIIGPDGKEMSAQGLILGLEKFQYPDKHFRLIWTRGGEAWFAQEDTSRYRKKYGSGGVVEAGRKLADRVSASFFSEMTR
jgi:hypothetical protein